jgi:glutamate 5-kinase
VSSGAVVAGYRKLGFIEPPTRLPEKQAAAIGSNLILIYYFQISMASGIPAFLGKSGVPGIIGQAVKKEAKGTYFEPVKQNTLSPKQQWIAFNSVPVGAILIKNSSIQRILNHKSGLHLNDIQGVEGDWGGCSNCEFTKTRIRTM